jgi:hypothetical protein
MELQSLIYICTAHTMDVSLSHGEIKQIALATWALIVNSATGNICTRVALSISFARQTK